MIKKEFKGIDFLGREYTEICRFNLTEQEMVDMALDAEGMGVKDAIIRLGQETDKRKIIEIFKMLIDRSYGILAEDGRHFIKVRPDGTRPIDEFKQTKDYSNLFMMLATDNKEGLEFIQGIIPEEYRPTEEQQEAAVAAITEAAKY